MSPPETAVILRAEQELGLNGVARLLITLLLSAVALSFMGFVQLIFAVTGAFVTDARGAYKGFLIYLPIFLALSTASWALLAYFWARCYVNLPRLTEKRPRLSPGIVGLGMFLPGLNLLVMGRTVRELWSLSRDLDAEEFAWGESAERGCARGLPGVWWYSTMALMLISAWSFAAFWEPNEVGYVVRISFLFLASLGAWSLLTAEMVRQLTVRQIRRRVFMIEVGREVVASPAAERNPNYGAAVIGFSLLGAWAVSWGFSVFVPKIGFYLAPAATQVALLISALAVARLQGKRLGELVPLGQTDFRIILPAGLAGFCLPLLTVPLIPHLVDWLGLRFMMGGRGSHDSLLVGIVVLITVLSAPLIEELVFRGIVYDSLRRSYSPALAVVGSAVAFALIHFHPVQVIITFFIGLLCGVARVRAGGILAAVAAHLGNNLGVLMLEPIRAVQKGSALQIVGAILVIGACLAVLFGRLPDSVREEWAPAATAGRLRRLWARYILGKSEPRRIHDGRLALRPDPVVPQGGIDAPAPNLPQIPNLPPLPVAQEGTDDPMQWRRPVRERPRGLVPFLRAVGWGELLACLAVGIAAWRAGVAGFTFARTAPLGADHFLVFCFYGIFVASLVYGQQARVATLAVLVFLRALWGLQFLGPAPWEDPSLETLMDWGRLAATGVLVLGSVAVILEKEPLPQLIWPGGSR